MCTRPSPGSAGERVTEHLLHCTRRERRSRDQARRTLGRDVRGEDRLPPRALTALVRVERSTYDQIEGRRSGSSCFATYFARDGRTRTVQHVGKGGSGNGTSTHGAAEGVQRL